MMLQCFKMELSNIDSIYSGIDRSHVFKNFNFKSCLPALQINVIVSTVDTSKWKISVFCFAFSLLTHHIKFGLFYCVYLSQLSKNGIKIPRSHMTLCFYFYPFYSIQHQPSYSPHSFECLNGLLCSKFTTPDSPPIIKYFCVCAQSLPIFPNR